MVRTDVRDEGPGVPPTPRPPPARNNLRATSPALFSQLEHVMRVAREALIMVRDQVLGEMREGLEKEDAMLHMLPSYVDR